MKKSNYILYFIGIVIILALLQFFFILNLISHSEHVIGNNAVTLSKAVANAIDVNEYEKIANSKIKNAYYKKMQNYLHKTLIDSNVKYLYVSRYISDKEIEYILDGSEDSLGVKDNNIHPYIYKTPKSTVEGLTHYQAWGTLITGNTPLINEQGQIVGLVGVDVDISNLVSIILEHEKPSILYSFIMLIIMLTLIILLLRMDYRQKIELIKFYKKSFDMLSISLSHKSDYTWEHSKKVSIYSEIIARRMGYKDSQIQIITWAALLHDIGKIGIPDSILNKPGKLTSEEYEEIKKHPIYSREILSNIFEDNSIFLNNKEYKIIMDIISYHHERWDGKGYPYGLKENQIPETARIVSLADSLEAMLAERPYKKPLEKAQILEQIRKNSRKQFDPHMVDIFLDCVETELFKF